MSISEENPFAVTSPEKLDASRAEQLFVEVFSDFPQVEKPGNAMIVGARGSGKSMMFRCMLPDVVMKRKKCGFNEIPFVAFHIPIKNTQLKLTELKRMDNHYAAALINEHFFTLAILIEICAQIKKYKTLLSSDEEEWKRFFEESFVSNAEIVGYAKFPNIVKFLDCMDDIEKFFKIEYSQFVRYVTTIRPNIDDGIPSFDLPLLSYRMFLHPFLQGIREFSGFPKERNIHLFIDDADNLSQTQTKVLNSWLGMRLQPSISLKVSTQLGKYKSFLSTDGTLVESPHDYQLVNISDKYTTSKATYFKRVKAVVEKRLRLSGLEIDAKEYFPVCKEQELAIEEEKKRLIAEWSVAGRGNRASDDAIRYARPNYIRNLGGTSKSRSTYVYAGFEQLVHLSSGVIRVFLESASLMYDATKKDDAYMKVQGRYIPFRVQDDVIRKVADTYMFTRFDDLRIDERRQKDDTNRSVVTMLRNLLTSMGATFQNILFSERSERRVFSIALSNEPDEEIKSVLNFGVETGYLHVSSIGRKDGAGRTSLYIMNRILSPVFSLDPTSFAGYLFVTNDALRGAMYNQRLLRIESEASPEPEQLMLFE